MWPPCTIVVLKVVARIHFQRVRSLNTALADPMHNGHYGRTPALKFFECVFANLGTHMVANALELCTPHDMLILYISSACMLGFAVPADWRAQHGFQMDRIDRASLVPPRFKTLLSCSDLALFLTGDRICSPTYAMFAFFRALFPKNILTFVLGTGTSEESLGSP